MVSDPTAGREFSLREALSMIAQRKWLLICVFAAFVVVTVVVSYRTTPRYRAVTLLNYTQQANISAIIGTASNYVSTVGVQQTLQTASNILGTATMAQKVATYLNLASPAQMNATVSAAEVGVTAEVGSGLTLLSIAAESTNPRQAATVANAYAQVWMAWRKSLGLAQVDLAEKVTKIQVASYKTAAAKASPSYAQAESNLTNLRMYRAAVEQGEYSVISTAPVPKAPYTPRHVRDALLGAILGLGVGLVSVFLAVVLDVRVHTYEAVGETLGLPVLGRMPRHSKDLVRTGGLVVLREPDGPGAEAFRVLRGNLDFVGIDGDMRSIVVTSCTQGEGKTSTVCNLAVTLAMTGKRVVVVDADMRRPRVHAYFGLSNRTGLSTVVAGKARLGEALQAVAVGDHEVTTNTPDLSVPEEAEARGKRIYVITAGPVPPNPGEIVASSHLQTLLAELVKGSDMVLVDAPPFMAVGDAAPLAARTDGIILVFKMGKVNRGMLKEAQGFLAPLPCRKLGVVVTNLAVEAGRYKYYRQHEEAAAAEAAEPV